MKSNRICPLCNDHIADGEEVVANIGGSDMGLRHVSCAKSVAAAFINWPDELPPNVPVHVHDDVVNLSDASPGVSLPVTPTKFPGEDASSSSSSSQDMSPTDITAVMDLEDNNPPKKRQKKNQPLFSL